MTVPGGGILGRDSRIVGGWMGGGVGVSLRSLAPPKTKQINRVVL